MKQDARRGTRTVVFSTVVLTSMAFIGWIIWKGDPITVRQIAWGLLVIPISGSIGWMAENVTQRIRIRGGPTGGEIEIGGNEP